MGKHRHLPLLAALLACSSSPATQASPRTLTSGKASLALSPDGTTLTFALAGKTLLTFGADAFQVGTVDDLGVGGNSFDPYWLFVPNPPPVPTGLIWRGVAAGGGLKLVSLSASQMVLELDSPDCVAQVTFNVEAAGISGRLSATVTGQDIAYLRLQANADPTEGFYGLGEWGDTVNQRGELRPMQMEIADLEAGDDENHVPVPLLLGTNGWGLFVAERCVPGSFNVAAPDRHAHRRRVSAPAPPAPQRAPRSTSSPSRSRSIFLNTTTRSPATPACPRRGRSVPLLWRDQIASQAQVIDDIAQIRSRHLATSGMWFDRPYATGVETFDFNPATFPDPPTMLQALHDAGLRYGVWQAPYTGGASNPDPAPAQLAYALANGFFPPTTGAPAQPVGQTDRLHEPRRVRLVAAEPRELHRARPGLWRRGLQARLRRGRRGRAVRPARRPGCFADGSDEETMHHRLPAPLPRPPPRPAAARRRAPCSAAPAAGAIRCTA